MTSCSIRHPAFILGFLGALAAVCKAQSTQASGIVFPKENEIIWRVLSNAVHLIGMLHSYWLILDSLYLTVPSLFFIQWSLEIRFLSYSIPLLISHPGVSVLSYCLARRTDKFSARGMRYERVHAKRALLNQHSQVSRRSRLHGGLSSSSSSIVGSFSLPLVFLFPALVYHSIRTHAKPESFFALYSMPSPSC